MKLSFLKQTDKQTNKTNKQNTIYNYNNIKQNINRYSNWTKYIINTLIDIFVA